VYSGRDRQERSFCERGGLARGAVSHVSHLLAGGFDVGVEFQCVLDEAAILLVLAPERDDVAPVPELRTCEVAVGERLFELLPRLDVVGRLPLLDLLGTLIDSVHDWTPSREDSVMVGTSWDSVRALLSYMFVLSCIIKSILRAKASGR